jgi:hypothetical protein
VHAPAPGLSTVSLALGGAEVIARTPGGTAVFGFMPVVPMVLISSLLMIVVSWFTSKPSHTTIERYFPRKAASPVATGLGQVAD